MSACTLDGTPTGDAAQLCIACGADLEKALAELPALLDDLDVTLSRQAAIGHRNGGRSSEKALPYDLRASETLGAARVVLAGWVQVHHRDGEVVELEAGGLTTTRWVGGDPWPRDTPQDMARWLLARLQRIRHHEAAADLSVEIRDVSAALRRATDGPAERWYAGPCGADLAADHAHGYANESCEAELYARPHAAAVTCPGCGTRYDVPQRRAWLLEHAEDRLLPGPEMARALTGLGREVTPARIRQWKHRSRLIPHAEDTRNGRPVDLFRVGDVLDLLAREAAKKASVA